MEFDRMIKISVSGHEPQTFSGPVTPHELAHTHGLLPAMDDSFSGVSSPSEGAPLPKVSPSGGVSSGKRKKPIVYAVRVNGQPWDLSLPIDIDATVEPIFEGTDEALDIMRHTGAHILAQAVSRLWPDTMYAIGPVTADGFYYDIDADHRFSPDDFALIEEEMRKIVGSNYGIERKDVSSKEAIRFFEERKDPYKVEIIQDLGVESVSIYTQGEFSDLCLGPHLPSTGLFRAFKVLSVAGSYWRGDEKNKKLQRIYATAFFKEDDLKKWIFKQEEAKKRDHRVLGRELELFTFFEESPGFPFWLPAGQAIYRELETYVRQENDARGYHEVQTPALLPQELWERSGHYDHFRDNMYFSGSDAIRSLAVKPMNCPGACLVYGHRTRSYRDLPLRISEMGQVHRLEAGGVMHGLLRVREFTQDDAHIYCDEEDVLDEAQRVIRYAQDVYKNFSFPRIKTYVATRPENFMGKAEQWDKAEKALFVALENEGLETNTQDGEGAFYGPKIEFHVEDCLGRTWQLGTIQVDFSMPQRFGLSYEGPDGSRHCPVMIHKAILGSLERFIGILIEHYAGKFPLWLSPTQAIILPVNISVEGYAQQVATRLREEASLRVDFDNRNEKLGWRMRQAQKRKVPYIFVIGNRESEEGLVNIRCRGESDSNVMALSECIKPMKEEAEKRLPTRVLWTS